MKNKDRMKYTPQDIANNLYLQNSYNDLMRNVRRGVPAKDVQYVEESLKAQFCIYTKEELIEFDAQVKDMLSILERKSEIQRLRNQISNKKLKLDILLNEEERNN